MDSEFVLPFEAEHQRITGESAKQVETIDGLLLLEGDRAFSNR